MRVLRGGRTRALTENPRCFRTLLVKGVFGHSRLTRPELVRLLLGCELPESDNGTLGVG
jgi:hypothetical protein